MGVHSETLIVKNRRHTSAGRLIFTLGSQNKHVAFVGGLVGSDRQ